MRIAFAVFVMMGIVSSAYAAVDLDVLRNKLEESQAAMDSALSEMRDACVGISTDLDRLKTLAGVGAGASAAGVLTGGGAIMAGVKKAQVDSDNIYKNSRAALWNSWSGDGSTIGASPRLKEKLRKSVSELSAGGNKVNDIIQQKHLQGTNAGKESKKLGDVRTGTLAVATVTNVAGAAVAGTGLGRSAGGLVTRVNACLEAGKELNNIWGQVRINKNAYDSGLQLVGKNPAEENKLISDSDLERVETIVRICDEWSTVNLSKIGDRATGALVTNVIGAASGAAGVATSAIANSDEMRFSGTDREAKLNKASNVLAGTTTVASGAATIFNASQKSVIKRASTIANACEGALK